MQCTFVGSTLRFFIFNYGGRSWPSKKHINHSCVSECYKILILHGSVDHEIPWELNFARSVDILFAHLERFQLITFTMYRGHKGVLLCEIVYPSSVSPILILHSIKSIGDNPKETNDWGRSYLF